ncbi:hypothetical protein BaRGS_00008854 [Batillaria attramentaria]|uniref:Secreted protein n=1 Tax=Batillaria attramentaria TaxID=370345 RepID=A0ABD0LKD9_9CAEN
MHTSQTPPKNKGWRLLLASIFFLLISHPSLHLTVRGTTANLWSLYHNCVAKSLLREKLSSGSRGLSRGKEEYMISNLGRESETRTRKKNTGTKNKTTTALSATTTIYHNRLK